MSIDVELVCTEEDLANEIGGARALDEILRDLKSETVRELALRDVLKSLKKRTPPIQSGDIVDPTELKEAVIYGSLARLYRDAMTTADDIYALKMKHFDKKYSSEMSNLSVTVTDHLRGAVRSWSMDRR